MHDANHLSICMSASFFAVDFDICRVQLDVGVTSKQQDEGIGSVSHPSMLTQIYDQGFQLFSRRGARLLWVQGLDYVVATACTNNMRVVLTLTNYLTAFGGMATWVQWFQGDNISNFYKSLAIRHAPLHSSMNLMHLVLSNTSRSSACLCSAV